MASGANPIRWYAKEWIRRSGLTQREVSERTGIHETYLSEILSGKERWNGEQLGLIATALNVLPRDLLREPTTAEASIESISVVAARVPVAERERALRAALRVLEEFAVPETPKAPGAPKRRKRT